LAKDGQIASYGDFAESNTNREQPFVVIAPIGINDNSVLLPHVSALQTVV